MGAGDILKSADRRKVAFNGLELLVLQNSVYRPDAVRPFRMSKRCQMVEITGMMKKKRGQSGVSGKGVF